MLYTAQTQNSIRQASNVGTAPAHNDDLETIMVIEVDVRRRENFIFRVVLGFDQLLGELGAMMVVDKRQGSHHRAILFHILGDRVVAYEIANGLGPVSVALLMNRAVKALKQAAFEGNSGSN